MTRRKILSFLTALAVLFAVLSSGTGGAAAAGGLTSKDADRALVSVNGHVVVLPGQTVGEVKKLFGNVRIFDARGSELSAGKTIRTGALVKNSDGAAYTVVVPGDTNGDGKVDSSDARTELRVAAKTDLLSGVYEWAADVSGDGRINAVDARAILRVAAKVEPFSKNTLKAVAVLSPAATGMLKAAPAGMNPSALSFPIRYSDAGISVVIDRSWYLGAWCYIAHLQMSDYSRLKTGLAFDRYGAVEKVSSFVSRSNCLLAVNGDYAEGYDKGVIRNGKVYRDGVSTAKALYSQYTGKLVGRQEKLFSELAKLGYTDSFEFSANELVVDGRSVYLRKDGGKSTPRTLVGTTGKPGEIYLIVTEGYYNDGISRGLQYWEAGDLLASLGCTLGIALDGGGSSAMVWNGKILNTYNDVREITGFVYVTR